MDHIDLSGYFVEKDYKTGRPKCDEQKLLKVILFAFMEQGYSSRTLFFNKYGFEKQKCYAVTSRYHRSISLWLFFYSPFCFYLSGTHKYVRIL